MRRALVTTVGIALTLSGSAAMAHAASPPTLGARLARCETDPQKLRAATFTAAMPALTGTRRMQMRFVLMQRASRGASFTAIDVPGWGWVRSDAGRAGLIATKRVASLVPGAAYRAVVTFRWYDARGRRQRQTTRTTRTCNQPDTRADLTLEDLTAVAQGANAVYTVVVRNVGGSASGPSTVALTVGGAGAASVPLAALDVAAVGSAAVTAARCTPGSTVTIRLDAGRDVDEAREADDVVTRPCPL
jgi:hypothetical protein